MARAKLSRAFCNYGNESGFYPDCSKTTTRLGAGWDLWDQIMARIHLFEFTDLSWYPQTFRDIQTDYLQFASSMGSGHKNLYSLFQKALNHGIIH